MNQSNKALRDSMAVYNFGRTYDELDDGEQLEVRQQIALVTNHIKGALPEKRSSNILPSEPIPQDVVNRGFNAAISEVHSILKEVI